MEKELVGWLLKRFGKTSFAEIGIGDDCAVLQPCDRPLVITCDAICEGTHFLTSDLNAEQIGRKAIAVNLSDLASMGAQGKAVLVSLMLPSTSNIEFAQRLYFGMEPLAKKYDIEICGGDTTVWDGGLVISITAMGVASKSGPWKMSGALPGDRILVTGSFGGSILQQHWAFEPRLDFADHYFDRMHGIRACTDSSDSLGIDLENLAAASGLGFELHLDQVPVSTDAIKVAKSSGQPGLHHAMTDGEDFQLIMAVDPAAASDLIDETREICPVTDIGCFTETKSQVAIQGEERNPFRASGYEHRLAQVNVAN